MPLFSINASTIRDAIQAIEFKRLLSAALRKATRGISVFTDDSLHYLGECPAHATHAAWVAHVMNTLKLLARNSHRLHIHCRHGGICHQPIQPHAAEFGGFHYLVDSPEWIPEAPVVGLHVEAHATGVELASLLPEMTTVVVWKSAEWQLLNTTTIVWKSSEWQLHTTNRNLVYGSGAAPNTPNAYSTEPCAELRWIKPLYTGVGPCALTKRSY